MKFIKPYKLFESVDEIKSTITDILRDNVLDKDIPLEIFIRNYTDIEKTEVVKIQIGFRDLPDRFFVDEDADFDDFIIRADELKEDILTITNYLKDEGYRYNTYSYEDRGDIKGNMGDVMDSIGLETTYLNLFYKKPIRETYLESFTSINESDDISFVKDLLLDISDGDVSIRVTDLKKYSPNSPIKKISIVIGDDGDEELDVDTEDEIDILKYIQALEDVNDYLSSEGYTIDFSHFIYTDEFEENASFYSIDFDEIKDKLQNIESLRICEIVYKNVEFINDYIKECKWDIRNSLANCAFFAKDFYQWCQKKGIDCKLAYCEQSAPINSQCEQEDHIIPMIGRYLIDFVYTDKGVSHIVRENNKSEALKRQTNPEVTEIGQFREKYDKWGYENRETITYEQAFGEGGRCQTIELKETIKVPIEIGDTVLGGRFKNKKIVVKKIGKNKKGDITINDKPLLKFRLVKESLQEDVDYYFRHLEDDNFVIHTENDYFRIFKPKGSSYDLHSYSYSNCNPFKWSEISGEIGRYIDELDDSENSEKSIDYVYVVKVENGIIKRKQIHTKMLLDENFDAGKILSFVIGFR